MSNCCTLEILPRGGLTLGTQFGVANKRRGTFTTVLAVLAVFSELGFVVAIIFDKALSLFVGLLLLVFLFACLLSAGHHVELTRWWMCEAPGRRESRDHDNIDG